MTENYEKNLNLFLNKNISINDVLLKPKTGLLKSRKEAIINTSYLYSSPMDTVTGIELVKAFIKLKQNSVFCRFLPLEERQKALELFCNNNYFWYSVGTSEDDFIFLNNFFNKNPIAAVNISVDVAHGDTLDLRKLYKKYSSKKWCLNLMSGTIANSFSAIPLIDSGCTHLRVGIGPGSACTTRIVTGCGIPNLTAVFEMHNELLLYNRRKDVTIIADGGIKNTGDIVKYLSAGANAVMLGSMLSTLKESVGWKETKSYKYLKYIWYFKYNNRYYKKYRGQASYEFQIERRGSISGIPEGVQFNKNLKPTIDANTFVFNCNSAISSAISYLGIKKISELNPNNIEFLKITQNGLTESKPHFLL